MNFNEDNFAEKEIAMYVVMKMCGLDNWLEHFSPPWMLFQLQSKFHEDLHLDSHING